MADEADGNENFFWDNENLSFSDISGGDISIDVLVGTVAGEDQDKDKGKKVLNLSNSNSPNILEDGVAVPMEATIGKKRSATTTNGGGGGGGSKKASGSGGVSGEGKGGGGDQSEHEIHIQTERERRKKMRSMFSSLQALIPHLHPKADKSTVVDEAVTYIKFLQQTLKQLQQLKLERLHGMSTMNTRESFMADQGSSTNLATINITNPSPSFSNIPRFPSSMNFQTWISPNVVLNVCGEDAHISVCSVKKPGLLSMICSILDIHKLEVVSAQVFGDSFKNMYLLQMRGNSTDYQLPEGFLVEEAFNQAAIDIMHCITNS